MDKSSPFQSFLLGVIVILAMVSFGQATARTWTSTAGTKVEAEFKEQKGDLVTLVTAQNREIKVKLADLSDADQAFVKGLAIEKYGSEIPGIAAVPGKISGSIKCENSMWTYHVYLPKQFHMGRKWPVWFIMSPGGGGGGAMMQRYLRGAERLGCIVVGSVESKNGFNQSQAAMEAMADDVYKRFPVEREFAFSSGMSGGSRQAFLLAEGNANVVGVLACGSGDGVYPDKGEYRQANLRAKTYVYSLIGTNCFNRTESFTTHKKFKDSIRCRLRFFVGNHDWADEIYIEQAMIRVVGQAIHSNTSLGAYKSDYLAVLRSEVVALEETTPWESHYLAEFGESVDRGYDHGFFAKATARLAKNPLVGLAQKAEKDIQKLCDEFYPKYDYFKGDRTDIPKRSREAAGLAESYPNIPHGVILTKLGEKSL